MSFLACVVSAAVACNDRQLTGPAGPRVSPPALSQGSPDAPVQGCATWKVTLSGGSGITVTSVSKPSCGPIIPLLDSAATYNPATKTVSLPIADSNSWALRVTTPARGYAWNDSIIIATPGGLKNGTTGTYLRLVGMDSTIGANSASFKNARLWKYDTLLAAHGQTQVLGPAQKSRRRSIQIQVVTGTPTVFTVLVRVQAQNLYPVPITPPDSEPAWLSDDSARYHTGRFSNGFFSKYAVAVQFQPGVSQQSMQAAIDSVRGRVIGGYPLQKLYIVQVPNPTDTSGTVIQGVTTKLKSFPQVLSAIPFMAAGAGSSYLRPGDGASAWGKGAWGLNRDSTRGQTWALNVLNAPMAWGCDTGSAKTPMAVVDYMLFRAPDLAPNLNVGLSTGLGAQRDAFSISTAHGTGVASLVAAVGDNTKGITGVMWRADLRVYNWARTPGKSFHKQIDAFIRAAMDGAAVINMSVGLAWDSAALKRGPGTGSPTQVAGDSRAVLQVADAMYKAIVQVHLLGKDPLVVISAGNNAINAVWNGFAAVKDPAFVGDQTYQGQVLVVGGIDNKKHFWYRPGKPGGPYFGFPYGSNFGKLVDVVAPAESVFALDTLHGYTAVPDGRDLVCGAIGSRNCGADEDTQSSAYGGRSQGSLAVGVFIFGP